MDANSMNNPPGKFLEKNKRNKGGNKEAKKKAVEEDGSQTKDQMDYSLEASDKVRDCEVISDLEKNLLDKDLTLQPKDENPEMNAGLAESTSEGNKATKKRKRRKRIEIMVENTNEVHRMEQSKVNTGTTENLAEEHVHGAREQAKKKDEVQCMNQVNAVLNMHLPNENTVPGNDEQEKSLLDRDVQPQEVQNIHEVQRMEQIKVYTEKTKNLAEGNVNRKIKRPDMKARRKVELAQSVNQVNATLNMHLMDENHLPVGMDELEKNLLDKDVNVLPLDKHVKIDAGSTENPSEGNEAAKKAGLMIEVQSMEQTDVNTTTAKNLAEGNVNGRGTRRKIRIKKKAKDKDHVESMYQVNDMSKIQLPDENHVPKMDELEKNLLKDVQVQPLAEHPKTDANSTNRPRGINWEKNERKRRRKKAKKKAVENDGSQTKDQMDYSLEASENVRDCEVTNNSENNFLDKDLTLQPLADNPKLDTGSTIQLPNENHVLQMDEPEKSLFKDLSVQPLAEHPKIDANSTNRPRGINWEKNERKRRRKKAKKKAVENDGSQTKDQMDYSLEASENVRDFEVTHNSENNFLDKDLTLQPLADNPKLNAGIKIQFPNESHVPQMDELEKNLFKDLLVLPLAEHPKSDANLMNGPRGKNWEKNQRRIRRKKEAKKKAVENDGSQTKEQMGYGLEASENVRDCEVTNNSEKNLLDKDLTLQRLAENLTLDAGSKMQLPNKNHVPQMDELEKNLFKDLPVQPLEEHLKSDANLMNNPRGKNWEKNQRRIRRKKEAKRKAFENDGSQTKEQMDYSLEASENVRDCEVTNNSENNFLDKDLTLQPLAKNLELDAGSTENPSKRNETTQKRKREKQIKKVAENVNGIQSSGQTMVNTEATKNLMEQTKVNTETTGTFSEGNVNDKREKQKKKKAKNKDGVQSSQAHTMLKAHVLDENHVPNLIEFSSNKTSSESVIEKSGHLMRKFLPCENEQKPHPNQTVEENEKLENVLTEMTASSVKEEECLAKDLGQFPRTAVMTSSRRKLLVLDLNGLLAHIIMPAPKGYRVVHILRRAIFRRPFCDDFLKFCFQNFDVGIWSSRSKRVIDKVVEYLLGDLKEKLVFCWDMSHCTQTTFKALENKQKLIVFKELRKIWENDDSKFPWKKEDYDESNTLLLDDSPYKSLLNPLHSAIFPSSYHYEDENDNSLGPGGDLRVYLEGLLTSDNVQKYVEQHPFGQSAINETNSSWEFYSTVLQSTRPLVDNTPSSLPTQDQAQVQAQLHPPARPSC